MEVSYFSPIRVQWNDLSGKVRRVATRAHQRDAFGALEPSRCSRFPRLASRCASSSPVRARSVENEHSGAALRASGTLRVRDPVVEDVVCSEHSSTVAVEVKLHAMRTNWKSEHDLERSAQRRAQRRRGHLRIRVGPKPSRQRPGAIERHDPLGQPVDLGHQADEAIVARLVSVDVQLIPTSRPSRLWRANPDRRRRSARRIHALRTELRSAAGHEPHRQQRAGEMATK